MKNHRNEHRVRPGPGRASFDVRATAIAAWLFLASLACGAQARSDSATSLCVISGLSLPASDAGLFDPGAATALAARFPVAKLPVAVSPEFGYVYQPIKNTNEAMSVLSLGAGARYGFKALPWLRFSPFAQGGYFFGFIPGSTAYSGRSAYFGGGLEAEASLGSSFGLSLGAIYRNYYGLYQTATVSLSATLRLAAGRASRARPLLPGGLSPLDAGAQQGQSLVFSSIKLDPVFPVLFKFYDDHPVGKVSIKNVSDRALEDVKISMIAAQYMDNPKLCARVPRIEPGAEATAELFALFNDRLLEVSEGTKVSAKVSVEYAEDGFPSAQEQVETLRIFDRNASMWDDDRKAAAFVTSKDPTVLRFAKNVLSMVKDKGTKAVNANLLAAMAFHEATRLYGLTYVVDPSNSYAAILQNKTAVDFLQFPRQTLDYKGGNCSAFSILYAALLESVGIETAFVTVPGHIFMAVSLGEPPDRARKLFAAPDDLIFAGEKSWLPIETTERSAGFVQAWQLGAKQWREHLGKNQAALFPIHEAWALYEPVGFASDLGDIALPDRDAVAKAYLEELGRFVDKEIFAEAARLEGEIARTGGSPKSHNQLGVLYARYGVLDKAAANFAQALKRGDYAPALINLGNIDYLRGRYGAAMSYFERARKLNPDSPAVLLAIARASHELEDYASAKDSYDKLKNVDPSLASRYAYLDLRGAEGTRAADASGAGDRVEWEREE